MRDPCACRYPNLKFDPEEGGVDPDGLIQNGGSKQCRRSAPPRNIIVNADTIAQSAPAWQRPLSVLAGRRRESV